MKGKLVVYNKAQQMGQLNLDSQNGHWSCSRWPLHAESLCSHLMDARLAMQPLTTFELSARSYHLSKTDPGEREGDQEKRREA